MILIIDNYDSFTWNLVQSLEILGANVSVKQNDDSSALANLNADGIIISPGPGIPADSGLSLLSFLPFDHSLFATYRDQSYTNINDYKVKL